MLKRLMGNWRTTTFGFTLVEVITTIVIIGILSSIGVVSYSRIQSNGRDAQRSTNANVIYQALETYYQKNGEYPDCTAMTQPASTIASSTLVGINTSALATPGAAVDDNSIICSSPDINSFGYIGGYSQYKLQYYDETDNKIITISSQHSFTIAPPSTPTIAVVLNGANVQATVTPVTCSAITTPEYAIRSRINDGTWGNYSDWSTTLVATQPASDGIKYGYQVQAHCLKVVGAFSDPITSTESTYIDPISTSPSAPVVAANTVTTTTTWSWTTPTCTVGSARYRYDYTISPSGYDSGWVSIAASPISFTTSTSGQTYTVNIQAQCYTAFTAGPWGTSGSAAYIIPAAPTAPVTAVILNGANVQATITPVTCTASTAQYVIRSRTNDGTWGGYTGWNTTTVFTQVANDGIKYGYQAQARCYLNATAISSTTTGIEATYIDPIPAPATPTVTANTVTTTTTWSWPAVSCAVGSVSYQYDYTISPSGYDSGWTSNGTNVSVGFTTSTAGQTYVVNVQAKCTGIYAASCWGASGNASYYRPKTWLQISNSGGTCGVASDSQAYCWSNNTYGQIGNNSTVASTTPLPVFTSGVLSGKTIKSISSGNQQVCVIASDNLAYCWGFNMFGGLGDNTTTSSSVPVAVNTSGVLSGKTIKSISAGSSMSCAIASDNLAYCWGYNSTSGRLGNNSTVNSSVPVAVYTGGVLSGKTIKSISAGNGHTCVIASDNQAYCWGMNWYGQLGNNTTTDSLVPVAVNTSGVFSGKTIKSISVGTHNTCAIASDNLAYCWGYNSNGQLGINSTTNSSVPVAVSTSGALSGKTILSILGGNYTNCAVASDNKAYCWGYNTNGQVGNNSTTDSWVPAAVYSSGVMSGKSVDYISGDLASTFHTCAHTTDNLIYCWGIGGTLGDGTLTQSLVPVLTNSAP